MKFRLLLALCGLTLFVAACAPTPQIRSDQYLTDESYLTSDPCGPPCWRNIVPGETTWEDAVILVQDDPTLDDFEQRVAEDTGARGAIWGQTGGDRCCQMFSQDGETISFIILQTTPENTLSTAIEVNGPPDYLIGEALTNDQALFSLFYVDVPMLLYVFVAGQAGAISETSEVVGFAYTTPDNMQLLIDTSELHAWEGYQSYSAYMDSEFDVTPRVTLTPSE